MAITYEWDVKTCDVYPSKSGKSNVVHNVHWRLTAEDDANQDANGNNITASAYGSQIVTGKHHKFLHPIHMLLPF